MHGGGRRPAAEPNQERNLGSARKTVPKLKPETQQARREHILDAAERCIANTGFHRTTMQDICLAAAISPGALYVYFDSKEALIAGISERDRSSPSGPRPWPWRPISCKPLRALGEQYFLEDAPPCLRHARSPARAKRRRARARRGSERPGQERYRPGRGPVA
jgi:AcrR family transcriptional regulator